MVLNKNSIIIDPNPDRICDKELFNYVAHVLCFEGEFQFFINDQRFVLTKGDCMILIAREMMNNYKASADLRIEVIYVTPEFIEVATPKNNYGIIGTIALSVNPIFRPSDSIFLLLQKDFKDVKERLESNHIFLDDVMICQTQLMFLDFYDAHAKLYGTNKISNQQSSLIEKFMKMLWQGDYVEHRDIIYYADRLCITPKYLSELTKQVSGMSANYWITRFTIIHIRRLLNDRNMTFSEISDMFGFSSPAYFSRFVQKNLGAPPSAFRQ